MEVTQEDYMELKKQKEAMDKEHKTMKAKVAAMENEKKTEAEKMNEKVANMEDENKTMKAKIAAMEEDKQTRDEQEKQAMAEKIASYEIRADQIKKADKGNRLKELLDNNDAKVLQAMLPYAEKSAKDHEDLKQAKQALQSHGGHIGSASTRYELDGLSEEDGNTEEIKQAAQESKNFLKSYRSGLYA